jgi:hypothetical protein
MLDFSDPLWVVALLVLLALVAVCLICTVGLADPATNRAQALQRLAEDDEVTADLKQPAPPVLSPWKPGLGIFLAVVLIVLGFVQAFKDRENQTKWLVMVLGGGAGMVWAIGLVGAALKMAHRIHMMYPGG